ncbi:hypothetical protein BIV60_06675 [Bacillus sp. MUM 116]|uniref:hypothetical protein n=1 Tax=Bacillus sp. MUM 116 TaxID=1678002 RepID=UPI0008F5B12D|nr:hypothetical protein [Bacillus sp. MUM 116]OIK16143.1 hypothetical protein BIV60_06675 [Bacillus sp. MUM 116]
MKFSNQSLEKLRGVHKRARHKVSGKHNFEKYSLNPIIHREIHGERIYVPLNLKKVWNGA